MILVSKAVADDMSGRAERLAEDPALQAVRRMPGYAAYERVVASVSEGEALVQADEVETERQRSRPSSPW